MQENAHPDDFPNTYSPTNESLYVLEFNAGFVKREGLSLGGSLSWQ